MSGKKEALLNCRVPDDVAEWIDRASFRINRSRSAVIRACILLSLPTLLVNPSLVDHQTDRYRQMHRGYVKLWRKSLDSGWLSNPILWAFWTWCLLKAAHKPTKVLIGFKEINLDPGQLIFGRKKCSKELGISEKKVRNCLHALKTANNLAIKRANKYSIITIINWHIYQADYSEKGQQNGQQEGRQRASKGPARGHIQELKECKECKEEKTRESANALSCPNSTELGRQPSGYTKGKGQEKHPSCPYQQIIDAYHEALPSNPKISRLDDTTKKHLQNRWREDQERQTLAWWRWYFAYCSESRFLTGQKTDFIADLIWLVRPTNMAKVLTGRYHHENRTSAMPARTRQNIAALEAVNRMIDRGEV